MEKRNMKYNSNFKDIKPQLKKDFYNPYAFVPLVSKPLLLSEDEKKTLENIHDVPLRNGVSGCIDVAFVTKSPLCIKQNDKQNVNIEDKYFIPGSSLKGMIRNVFEIVTLSNIKNSIANSRYSMRDIRSNDYELKSTNQQQSSGFLIKIKDRFMVMPCESFQYSYSEIEDIEGVDLKFEKSILDKYRKIKYEYIFQDENTDEWKFWFFSGFMNNKENEFLFDIPKINLSDLIPFEDEAYDDFIFIHEKENENANWKFWKKKLKNYLSVEDIIQDQYEGIVPCFYRTEIVNGEKKVKDVGFSYLYRQPYKKKIHDFLPDSYQSSNEIDMTQSLFGYANSINALKGRLHFSNAFIMNGKNADKQYFIFGKPKPTYYPFYLEQDSGKKLKTYFSNETKISGWKRYILHETNKIGKTTGKVKVESDFIPIQENASFNLKIRFHNLHQHELGALLLSLTFNNDDCYHSLGYAKSQGYGKIKLKKINLNVDGMIQESSKFIDKYFDYLKVKLGGNFNDFEIVFNRLVKLCSANYFPEKDIRYPDLNSKEFEKIKNCNFSIKDFSPDI
jgi:CRISPR-associated protein (TIGR03986 family)